jgi:hypothetical protein
MRQEALEAAFIYHTAIVPISRDNCFTEYFSSAIEMVQLYTTNSTVSKQHSLHKIGHLVGGISKDSTSNLHV